MSSSTLNSKSHRPSDSSTTGRSAGEEQGDRGLRSARLFLPALIIFVVLFGLYQLLLQSVLAPAVYSENDSQSALINLQATLYGEQEEVALVGSSISARFLDEFFDESGLPVMGLGLDAQGPALGIDLLADAKRIPGTVAIEINRSLYSSSGNEETINNVVASPGFDLAGEIPGLRAESRPTSIFYTELKRRADDAGQADSGDGLEPEIWLLDTDPDFDLTTLTEEQQAGATRVVQSIDEAIEAGACIVLYIAPDKGFAGPAEQAFAEYLSFTYGIEVIDLRTIENEAGLNYTDHIHLDIASARLISHVLAEAILDLQAERGCR